MPSQVIELWSSFVSIADAPLFRLGRETISLRWLFQVVLLLILVAILARFFKGVLKNQLLPRLGLDLGNREAISTVMSGAGGALGYIIVLQAVGINLDSLAVIIGGLGVGIGFGLQDVTRNLISGLTLLIERKVRVGDFVEIENISGYVQEVSMRATVIQTFNGSNVVVPNTYLADSPVLNWYYETHRGRIDIPIGVAYGTDPVLVTEVLLNIAHSEPDVLREPAPRVIFREFGDSALKFELWVWTDAIERRVFIKSSLNFKIDYYFRQHNISIPFPQRDIWIRNAPALSPLSEPAETVGMPLAPATPSLKSLLQQVSYFQCMNDLQLRFLIESGYRKHLAAKEILFRAQEAISNFYIVLQGQMAAVYEENGELKPMMTFNPGEHFGELPLMLGVACPTTMMAMTDTVLFVLPREGFEQLLKEHPSLADDIAVAIARRQDVLAQHQQELQQLSRQEADQSRPINWIRDRLQKLLSW
ncbi:MULTISPECIES: mechanosensitive ion channel domain-containing protein [unclassified Thermosynechococcus]|uniref:mechanosensitive ion channel domain-containing protein n=1 Tax=unclassified Thermosynechococcus TaxID=2622553 RepID=UPI001981142A|nr:MULTISPECIES: mechanosensitive ion channel domain-containing protein [unclassified Thermosynechococcus]QSF48894.1 mechanosensitive ion channel [Thermosynechococcus sp. TA-1]WNC21948.1 mechanosensitive ion channel [Thermosynechococcus sp. PP22]WNC32187.1 mechanosensitive ion channel [Thermosynechococcus sp. PKX95]WNC34715.1 mechanosensitive ion channel [Thermosynechococcus sp. PKX91]WNC37232.1 mechanosensitive ion channel [Thermosynechococcus sp. WL11]